MPQSKEMSIVKITVDFKQGQFLVTAQEGKGLPIYAVDGFDSRLSDLLRAVAHSTVSSFPDANSVTFQVEPNGRRIVGA